MARRMLGPAPAAPTHAATKAYVDAEVLNATGGGLTEGGLVSLVHDDGSAIRTALDALYEGGGGAWGEITGELADQTDLAAALDGKADAVHAHGLDDITGLPTALDGKADAVHEHHYSEVSGLGTAALADIADFATAAQGARADTAVQPADLADVATSGHYDDLTGAPALAEVATSGSYTDLDDTPALAPVATTGAYADLDGTPALAAVATSGAYADLAGTPDIPAQLTDLDTTTTGTQLDAMRTKLDGIQAGAQVNVQPDWAASSGPAAIANKPTLGSAAATDAADYATAAQGALAATAVQPGDLAAVATSGDYGDLSGVPDIPTALADLDTATTGAQLDAMRTKLGGIETGAQVNVQADWDAVSGPAAIANRPQLAAVALSGDYGDLTSTPSIPAALTDLGTAVTGAQLDALKVKVDGIEDGADVTDAARVAAAGAVMASDNDASGFGFVVDEDTMASNLDTRVPTQQSVKAYVDTALGGKADASHTHSIGDVTGLAAALDGKQDALGFTPEDSANRGVAGGYATLDNAGKVPVTQLPNSVMEYQGTWDAATNTPTLTDGVGNIGDVYRITVGATRDLGSGPIDWDTGQYAIYNGTIWERSGASDGVSSVAGRTGDVVLTKADVGLSNVDNTADADKPVSTAAQAALDTKQAKFIMGTSATTNTTAAKVVSAASNPVAGDVLAVIFTGGNNVNYHTLDVNGAGAATVLIAGRQPIGGESLATNGGILFYLFDGTYFHMLGSSQNTQYGEISEAEIDAGTAATPRAITARRLAYLIGLARDGLVADDDPRLSDSRTPTAHTHNASDINAGTLAYARLPVGTTANTVAAGNDSRMTNQRVPTDNSVSTAKIQDGAVTAAKLHSSVLANRPEIIVSATAPADTSVVWVDTSA